MAERYSSLAPPHQLAPGPVRHKVGPHCAKPDSHLGTNAERPAAPFVTLPFREPDTGRTRHPHERLERRSRRLAYHRRRYSRKAAIPKGGPTVSGGAPCPRRLPDDGVIRRWPILMRSADDLVDPARIDFLIDVKE
jgi:hypothetical protein